MGFLCFHIRKLSLDITLKSSEERSSISYQAGLYCSPECVRSSFVKVVKREKCGAVALSITGRVICLRNAFGQRQLVFFYEGTSRNFYVAVTNTPTLFYDTFLEPRFV